MATLLGSPTLWAIFALVSVGTYMWRAGGTAVAAYINPDGALFQWFSCLAFGMLAGLISRIILLPVGVMAETLLVDRLLALAAGFVLYFVFKRQMLAGIIGSVFVFAVLAAARQHGIL